MTKSRAFAFAFALALTACSGSDGANGAQGPQGPAGQDGAAGGQGPAGPAGTDGKNLSATAEPESCSVCHRDAGSEHQAVYKSFTDGLDPATSKLAATIVGVTSAAEVDAGGAPTGKFTWTVEFTMSKNGIAYNDDTPIKDSSGKVTSPALGATQQKTVYYTKYDLANKGFPTGPSTAPNSISFGTWTRIGDGRYTAVKKGVASAFDAAVNAMVYAYFGDTLVMPVKGHYNLMDNVASVSKVFGTIDYVSTANVAGCEKCHPAPYSKHGYRQARVAGLNDFVACKACHTDQRTGSDHGWQVLADDPAAFAAGIDPVSGEFVPNDAQKAKYDYDATVMNDTHMSHAMEFEYPQSMANCATCHEGKLANILTDAKFTLTTCKSCHPVTGPTPPVAGRAPALASLLGTPTLAPVHPWDLYTFTGACNLCHSTGGVAKVFSKIHTGYDSAIYSDNAGTKYSDSIKANIDSASFDAASNKLTVAFSVSGAATGALVKPTVVMSLYGYDTKDFIVTGHGSQADGKRNLEWAEGASGNSPRLTVVPGAAALSWVATADLTTWAAKLADGSVKRLEIGILPNLGANQTAAIQTDPTKAGYNPYIAIAGQTRTFDLVAKALVADSASYGKAIVVAAKCNSCHDALGTTFHSPAYGSAGVVACRLCHVPASGGSHLEMQSRSIDSYVHAIHSFQAFDVKGIDFTNSVQKMRYGLTVESTYPNFTILNCESCHNAGTYGAPDQSKSLFGALSASAVNASWNRNIGVVPSVVTGPGSRACGSCHRAAMINEDDAGHLAAFDAHTATFGTRLANDTGVLDAAIAKIMALFK
ncbi:MAG TPA: hypothetical protein VI300_15170 [Solirubrobacter sp.]